jgi:hypothetical protein
MGRKTATRKPPVKSVTPATQGERTPCWRLPIDIECEEFTITFAFPNDEQKVQAVNVVFKDGFLADPVARFSVREIFKELWIRTVWTDTGETVTDGVEVIDYLFTSSIREAIDRVFFRGKLDLANVLERYRSEIARQESERGGNGVQGPGPEIQGLQDDLQRAGDAGLE